MKFAPSFCLVALGCVAISGCAVAPPRLEVPQATDQLVSSLDRASLRCFAGAGPLPSQPLVAVLLSPRMVYSLLQWPRMQREAEALGFQVKAWREPRVPEAEWLGALGAAGWNRAPELLPLDCLAKWLPMEHFPVVRVLRRDQMHNWPIWGVMPTQAWQASLLNRKAALSGALALAGIP